MFERDEILATEDREESQSEEIKRNSQASQSVGMQRMSMKRNRDTGMSSIKSVRVEYRKSFRSEAPFGLLGFSARGSFAVRMARDCGSSVCCIWVTTSEALGKLVEALL